MLPFVLYGLFIISSGVAEDYPHATLPHGQLRGQYLKTVNNKEFSSFTGIPYAKPPVGELRFQLPQPAEKWKGVLNVTNLHNLCPQILTDKNGTSSNFYGNEDCLYLNVYTPQLEICTKKIYPVMIFIHGGSFSVGNANRNLYDPATLLDQDIILVAMNYRLGPLGFITTGDGVVPGNNGLKDQSLAIQWVKDNIEHFGGNPDLITLFGQSSGGGSAHYHMLSPMSKDLLHTVITHSGTGFTIGDFDSQSNNTLKNSKRLAEGLGCPGGSTEMISCLRNKNVEDIIRAQDKLYVWYVDPIVPFKPIVDGTFLPRSPEEIIKADEAAKIPFVGGITTEDGAIRAADLYSKPELLQEFSSQFDRLAPVVFFYDHFPNKDEITKKIKKFYFDDQPIDDKSRDNVAKLFTDTYFLNGVNKALKLHLKYTKQPVYHFVFGYRGHISYCPVYGGDANYDYGTCHVDDTLYLLTPPELVFPGYILDENHKKMDKIMTKLWRNFAHFGDPTPHCDETISTLWTPIQSEKLEYYSIQSPSDISMKKELYKERVEFWKELGFQ